MTLSQMMIYCCQCEKDVNARLTDGIEIYPHHPDLKNIPMWVCDTCGNYVGCHHKTKNRTRPLGNIPNNEIREARKHIHKLIDPIWKSKKIPRQKFYGKLSRQLGHPYHTGEIKTVEEARKVYEVAKRIIMAT